MKLHRRKPKNKMESGENEVREMPVAVSNCNDENRHIKNNIGRS
jgi:hypothetical protein